MSASVRDELSFLVRALQLSLTRRQAFGLRRVRLEQALQSPQAEPVARKVLPVASPAARPAAEPPTPSRPDPNLQAPSMAEPARAVSTLAQACTDLAQLRDHVAACQACGLCRTRTQTVFSDGSSKSGVVFVGEAPGEQEDRRGLPFVGPAGQLLTDIIEKGMGLKRAEVYICNVLKCRPPENRDPAQEEKALCTPWLDRQLDLVAPKMVIALGRHAANHLLQTETTLGRLRGRIHVRGRLKILATYHPAYLLRNPAEKKECWADIQIAMRELGLTPPARPKRTEDLGEAKPD